MELNPRLTQMLVKRLLKKYEADEKIANLSTEDKQELRQVIEEMQGKVEDFLEDHPILNEEENTEEK